MVIMYGNFKCGDVEDVGVGFEICLETLRNTCWNVQTLKLRLKQTCVEFRVSNGFW